MARIFTVAIFAAMLTGCASAPKIYKVESVYICASEECGQAAQNYGVDQVLSGLDRLLQANDGQTIKFCDADQKTHECKSSGVCHYVQGGPFPGSGCIKDEVVKAPTFDGAEKKIHYDITDMTATFMGIPAYVEKHGVDITARSINEIVWKDETFYTNWMIVGNQDNEFSFAVEYIDFDRGVVGGYWVQTSTGTGASNGSGYGLMTFPRAMPVGENWLDDAGMQPVRAAAVQQSATQALPVAAGDKEQRLEELKRLREKGLLSEDVYKAKQNEILNGL